MKGHLVQFLFCAGLQVVGSLALCSLSPSVPAALAAPAGLPLGALIWVLGGCLLLGTGLPYTGAMIAGWMILATLALGWVAWRSGELRIRLRALWPWLAASIAVGAALHSFNASQASYDSHLQLGFGLWLASKGTLAQGVGLPLSSWGAFLPLVQSAAGFLDEPYLFGFQPLLTFSLVGLLVGFVIMGWRVERRKAAMVAAVALVLVLASTDLFIFEAFYIHNNMPSAVYLLLMVGGLWLGEERDDLGLRLLGVIGLLGFALCRTEGPIFALLFLVPWLAETRLAPPIRLRLLAPYFAFILLWQVRTLTVIGTGSDIMNPARMGLMLAVQLGVVILLVIGRWRAGAVLVRLAPVLMLTAEGLLLLSLVIVHPIDMLASITAWVVNLGDGGRWGATWLALGFAAILLDSRERLPNGEVLTFGIPAFLILLLDMGAARSPYRIGWGDSGNRIMTHVLPLALLYVALRIGQPSAKPEQSKVASRWLKVAPPGLLALALAVAMVAPPPDPLRDSAVLMVSPPLEPDHDLAALRHSGYLAAAHPGPATLIFDLQFPINPKYLAAMAVPGFADPADVIWYGSGDGRSWIPLYDPRDADPYLTTVTDSSIRWFPSRGIKPIRYLRGQLPADAAGGRLALSKLRFAGNAPSGLIARSGPGARHTSADLSTVATSLVEPAWAEGHHLSLALRGMSDDQYAETAEDGKAEVVLSFGPPIPPSRVRCEGPGGAAIPVRLDGMADPSVWGAGTVMGPGEATFSRPLRQLRLRFEPSDGRSRLRLQRLEIRPLVPPVPHP